MNRKPGKLSKRISKVLTVFLIVIISFAVLSAGFTAVFFSVFFSRADEADPAELSYSDLGDDAPPREKIGFQSGGNRLCGYLYFPKENAKGIVLIAAGIASGADSHLSETVYFIKRGFAVFSFDGTGVQKSEGRGVIGLSQSKLDTKSALETLRADARTASLPVFLYGHSVGGYACAALCGEEGVRAAVSIGAFASPEETMLYYGRKNAGFLADLEYPFLALENRILFGADANGSAVDSINSCETPVLIVEGTADRTVPAEIAISAYAQQITNPNASFLIVSEEYRSAHSAAWLSADAAKYRAESSVSVDIDKVRANALDPDFMDQIAAFFERAL